MSSGRKTVAAFAIVLGGLVLIIVGLVTDCPLWLWPALAALLVTGVLVLVRTTAPPPDPFDRKYLIDPDVPVPPAERRESTVTDVLLPTSEPDYDFLFSARIRWCPMEGAPELPSDSQSGLAVSAVLARAREISATHPPNRASFTQHELAGALSTMQPGPTHRVAAMATDVTLRLSEADATRLERLATVRKEKQVWAHEREYECDRREYLGNDVLKDTGTALVWWLANHEDQLKQAVEEIGPLAQLSSAANNRDVPEQFLHMAPYPRPVPETNAAPPETDVGSDVFPDEVPAADPPPPSPPRTPEECFSSLLDAMGVQDRDDAGVLARYLSEAAERLGHKRAADALRDRFDLFPRDFPRGFGGTDEDNRPMGEDDASAPLWD